MPTIFESCPGRVTKVTVPTTNCDVSMVSVLDRNGNTELTYEKDRIVLTRVTVNQNVNVQFLHSLGNRVYIYSFGDRLGQITLSGMAFATSCEFGATSHSAKNVLEWYKTNKASTRGDAIRVSIFDYAFQAFLISLTADVVDDKTKLVQWSITLATLPE